MTNAMEKLIYQMGEDREGKTNVFFTMDGMTYIASSYRVLVIPEEIDFIVGFNKLNFDSHENVINKVLNLVDLALRNENRSDVGVKTICDIKQFEKENRLNRKKGYTYHVLYSDGHAAIDARYIKQGDMALHLTSMYTSGKCDPILFTNKAYDKYVAKGTLQRLSYPLYIVFPVNRLFLFNGCIQVELAS